MKKVFKILGLLLLVVVVGVAGLLTYVKTALPDIPVKDLKVEATPERIERGKYLAYNVCLCMDCHSTRIWTEFSGPYQPGTEGKGGEVFNHDLGFPGVYTSKNITPAGIGNWTDGEIYRAITSGVSKSGAPLFPVMPYLYYNKMDTEDIYSVIAFIRTLKPIENKPAESVPDFPLNFIMHTIPQPASPQKKPDPTDKLAYGAYICNASACLECHTKTDGKGNKLPGMDFAGGFEFKFPNGNIIRSANLTPDAETGMTSYTRETFIEKFKAYADSTQIHQKVAPDAFNSPMPWTMYAGMKEEDLGAIYDYLKTLKPVKHSVEKFTPGKG